MKNRPANWKMAALCLALIVTLSCGISTPGQETTTPGANLPPIPANGSSNGSQGGASSSNGNGGSNSSPNSQAATPNPTPEPTPTPTPTPNPTPSASGPYVVKQIVSLGKETISGVVCNVANPFTVQAVAPAVSWSFLFVPASGTQGAWTYAYNIKSAGETHSASGTYTITPAGKDGTLLLTMTGRDNVAFKGFSGPMPIRYSFNLAPTGGPACP